MKPCHCLSTSNGYPPQITPLPHGGGGVWGEGIGRLCLILPRLVRRLLGFSDRWRTGGALCAVRCDGDSRRGGWGGRRARLWLAMAMGEGDGGWTARVERRCDAARLVRAYHTSVSHMSGTMEEEALTPSRPEDTRPSLSWEEGDEISGNGIGTAWYHRSFSNWARGGDAAVVHDRHSAREREFRSCVDQLERRRAGKGRHGLPLDKGRIDAQLPGGAARLARKQAIDADDALLRPATGHAGDDHHTAGEWPNARFLAVECRASGRARCHIALAPT